MESNQTTTSNLFTIFGTPSRVIVDGTHFKNKYVIAALLSNLTATPQIIKVFRIIRIAGVVTLYIKTTGGAAK